MKLEQLSLANFRGFDQLDVMFAPDMTILAGANGVGKTGVLQAIVSALSFALPELTVSKAKAIPLAVTDIKNGKDALSVSATISLPEAHVRVNMECKRPMVASQKQEIIEQIEDLNKLVARRAKLPEEHIHKVMQERSGANTYRAAVRAHRQQLAATSDRASVRILPDRPDLGGDQYLAQARQQVDQPLAVWYGTTRRFSPLPLILPKAKRLDKALAWSGALDMVEVSLNDFANWFRVVHEAHDRHATMRAALMEQLERAITTFVPGVSDLALDTGSPPRFSVQKEGERFYLAQLSDGERGLLALVFDLIRRLAIANPGSTDPAAQGRAIVLIDEIEFHLHPKWQRTVLANLRKVFRQCQFIVTTQSPSILGEVPARCVRYFELDQGRIICSQPDATKGVDVNGILQGLMGAPARNPRYENWFLRNLFMAIENESFEKARLRIQRLKKILGERDPELIRAQALIHFLQDDT